MIEKWRVSLDQNGNCAALIYRNKFKIKEVPPIKIFANLTFLNNHIRNKSRGIDLCATYNLKHELKACKAQLVLILS